MSLDFSFPYDELGPHPTLFWLRQELKNCKCPFVRLMNSVLELTIFNSGQSQVSLRALCAYFVVQTKPKILCLVLLEGLSGYKLLIYKSRGGVLKSKFPIVEYYNEHNLNT